jgi:hypothetical protein
VEKETQQIILQLTLNSQQLLQELGKVREAQRLLRADTASSKKELEEYAKGTRELTPAAYEQLTKSIAQNERELVGLTRQAANLNKELDATEAAAGSYNAAAAATAVLQKNLKEAAVGVNITQEAYDELTAKVKEGLEAQRNFARGSGDVRALVGAYKEELGPSLQQIVVELAKVQAQQKGLGEGSAEYKQLETAAIGFKQAAQQAGAQAGLTREQTTAYLGSVAPAIAPAVQALVGLQQAQSQAAAGSDEYQQIGFKVAQAQAAVEKSVAKTSKELENQASVVAPIPGSLAAVRARLDELRTAKESIEPGTEAMAELNAEALRLKTIILESDGVIDEFGDRIERNAKREDIATLGDAFGGLTAAINVSTLLLGDNATASELQAKATQAVAVAESIRSIQIGIASAKDAAAIIVSKAKSILLKEQVVTTEALTAATAGQAVAAEAATVATGGQAVALEAATVATGQATVAAEALDAVLVANPVGIVVVAVLALVGALAILYNKLKVVRDFLAPLVDGFKAVATAAADALGLSDTAAEAAVESQKKVVDGIALVAKGYELQSKQLQQQGKAIEEYRAKERLGIVASYNATRDYLLNLRKLRAEYTAEGKEFTKEQEKEYLDNAIKVKELGVTLGQFDIDTKKQLADRAKAEADAAKKAKDEAKKLAEEQLKLQREQLQRQLGYVKIRLDAAVTGSAEERGLLIKQADLTRQIEITQYGKTLADKKLAKAQYQADVLKIDTAFARSQAALDLAVNKEVLQAQIVAAGEGTAAQIQLKRKLVATDYQLELEALDKKVDNSAKELQLKRETQAQLLQLELQANQASQDIADKHYSQRVAQLKAEADLMTAGVDPGNRQRIEVSQAYYDAQKGALAVAATQQLQQLDSSQKAQLLLAGENEAEQNRIKEEGEAERKRIAEQYAIDSAELYQQRADKEQAIETAKYQKIAGLVQDSLGAISTIQDAQYQAATSRLDAASQAQIALAGNDAKKKEKIQAQTQKEKERLEKDYNEKRRKMAIVQAVINGALAVTEILRSPTAPFVEPFATAVRAVQIGLVVATTAGQVAALASQKFARGGVAKGPSHNQGGIPLTYQGQHAGYEIEGDEIIMAAGVYRNPLLRGLANTLNQLGGGEDFLGSSLTTASVAKMAAGGVVQYDPAAFSPQGSSSQGQAVDVAALVTGIVQGFNAAVANLPPPIVAVSDIDSVQKKVKVTADAADIS